MFSAFLSRQSKLAEHSHNPEAIASRIKTKRGHNYLSDMIYGGIDGAISTLAIVSGIAGAGLSMRINIILGVASLIADGFSMAAGNFLSTRSEWDNYEFYRDFEHRQINENPEGEREEIRQIYKIKGFEGNELERIVKVITADKELWVKTMLQEEYGLPDSIRAPHKAALATFLAFLVCGFVPILPYIIALPTPFKYACLFTGVVFFAIGSIKSHWSIYSWWRSGITTLLLGGTAALIAFYFGFWVESWVRTI